MKLLFNTINQNKYIQPKAQTSEQKTVVPSAVSQLPLSNFNKYLVNFNGLTRDLSKTAYPSRFDVQKLTEKHSKSNNIVGSLPYEMIQKIPFEKREKNIKELYASMNTIIKDFRSTNDAAVASDKLTEAFQKAQILSDDEKITMDFINGGAYGDVYKLQGLGSKDEYIIKVFHQINSLQNEHGNFIEQNKALFWQNQAGTNTERVRFYFGDLNSGYMVNKYIGENVEEIKKNTLLDKYGMQALDEEGSSDGHNKLKGYCIDWGGIKVRNPILAKNKTAREIYGKLRNAFGKKQVEIFNEYLKKGDSETTAGLIANLNLFERHWARDRYREFATIDDNKVKEALIYNLGILNNEEGAEYFKKFAQNPDAVLKSALVKQLNCKYNFDTDYFEILANNSNEAIDVDLAKCLDKLPEKKCVEWFETFAKKNDLDINYELVSKLKYLPEEKHIYWYEHLANQNEKNNRIELINNINELPETDLKVKWFEFFAKDANEKEKLYLIYNLSELPGDKIVDWFETFAKDDSPKIKDTLAYAIRHLPEKKRVEWFENFAKDADDNMKSILAISLFDLPEDKCIEWFDKFAQGANTEMQEILISGLADLDVENRPGRFEVLAKEAKDDRAIKLMIDNIQELHDKKLILKWFEYYAKDKKFNFDLIGIIQELPKKEIVNWYEKFAENANSEEKIRLISKLKYLPEDIRNKWIEKFSEDSDENVRAIIYYDLDGEYE